MSSQVITKESLLPLGPPLARESDRPPRSSKDAEGDKLPRKRQHVRGLDSIRLVCAVAVVICHCKQPLVLDADNVSSMPLRVLIGVYNNACSASAAVIAFFVVSGFCIHYSGLFLQTRSSWLGFVARRWLRIWLPLLGALAIGRQLGMPVTLYTESILWSLYVEIIYYTLYPLIRAVLPAVGWRWLVLGSYVGAIGVALTNPLASGYPSYGVQLNWLLGLPCWLLGCLVAEWYFHGSDSSANKNATSGSRPHFRIWCYRTLVWGASVVASVLRFHGGIGHPWTLNLFAILVALWLKEEIVYHSRHAPVSWMEWLGRATYSMYIIHLPISRWVSQRELLTFGETMNWFALMAILLAATLLFYFTIELPSHWLARKIPVNRMGTAAAPA